MHSPILRFSVSPQNYWEYTKNDDYRKPLKKAENWVNGELLIEKFTKPKL